MKFSVFRLISLTFSLVIDSQLADRFRLPPTVSDTAGLGDLFVDETGGDKDDCLSESFSLSFELLLVRSVTDRLMKLRPVDEVAAASGREEFSEVPFEPSV